MERETLRDRLRGRVWMTLAPLGDVGDSLLDAIMRDVDVYSTMAARDGFVCGWAARVPDDARGARRRAVEQYPLPKCTRQVLREEPDPLGDRVTYTVAKGEVHLRPHTQQGWEILGAYSHHPKPTASRIRLWADLLANPYRTEEVEADESNPWGDDE